MTDLARQAAEKFLEGLRTGYDLAMIAHKANPTPEGAGNLDRIKKSIDAIEAHIAKFPPGASRGLDLPAVNRLLSPSRSYDPVKAAADRAEQRSAQNRKGKP